MRFLAGNRIPNLAGCVCTAFLAEHSYSGDRLQNLYHAFYLQINDSRWHRLGVSCRGVYWKAVPSPDHPPIPEWEFRLLPIQEPDMVGRRIQNIDYAEREPYGFESEDNAPDSNTPLFFGESILRVHFEDNFHLEICYRDHDVELRTFRLSANRLKLKKAVRRPR